MYTSTSALDGGEWSDSRPGRLPPKKRAPGTNWIGGWIGSRAVLDAVVKRKIPSPRRDSNPRTPIVQPVAQRYTDWAITALKSPNVEKNSTSHFNIAEASISWYELSVGIHTNCTPFAVEFSDGSGAHPASYPMGIKGSFPGGKAAGAWSWPLTPSSAEVREWVALYRHSPNTPSWCGARLKEKTATTLPFIYFLRKNYKNKQYVDVIFYYG
jgi:hypothetical protein